MRAAVHLQALIDIFAGLCDPVTGGAVLSSKIALTPDLLSRYHNALGNNTQYQAWFQSTAASNRLTLHLPQLAPPKVQQADTLSDGYSTACYFGGSNFVADRPSVGAGMAGTLENLGANFISPRSKIQGTIHGDNPFYAISIQAGGALGFDVFNRFILPEENIVVYDKYINSKSVELLKHFAGKLSAGATMEIYHSTKTGRNLLLSNDIAAQVASANSKISVNCRTCTHAFTSLEHDRYVFLGSRIQMVFTVGLDCFGGIDAITGNRVNRRSRILFYDVTSGDPLEIQATDGSVRIVKHHPSHTG